MSDGRYWTHGLLVAACLLLVGASSETKGDPNALSRAARMGLIDEVERLLDEGTDPSATDAAGWTPLAAARVEGFDEVAALLLRNGAADAPWDPAGRIDVAISTYLDADTPGIAVLVSQHGEVVYEATVGSANLERRVPVTQATQFRIGSITKQFTATGILLLEQDGKLRVTDPLSKFIPDYPRGDDITLHHLLTHTSGIPGYTEKPGFFETVTAFTTTEELVESFKQDPLVFEPGTQWAYSNSGYTILGYIVELVSESSYGDFLRQRIFEPLGMRDTGVHPVGIASHREAKGYALTEEGPSLALNWDMSRAAGAGALYSTVRDLYRWNEVLFSQREGRQKLPPSPLSPATFARALERARLLPNPASPRAEPETTSYGHGWGIGRDRGLAVISHGGGLHGFTSSLARYREAEVTIVVLHNARPSTIDAGNLGRRIAQLYLWRDMEKRPAQRVDPAPDRARWPDFTGRYAYARMIQVVSLRNGQLHAQLTGQSEHEIFPARRDPSHPTGEGPE